MLTDVSFRCRGWGASAACHVSPPSPCPQGTMGVPRCAPKCDSEFHELFRKRANWRLTTMIFICFTFGVLLWSLTTQIFIFFQFEDALSPV